MSIRIVPLHPSHIPALAAVETACFSRPWSEAALTVELTNPAAVFIVALLDGEAAGYAGAHVAADEAAIANVAVHPRHRRRGVATALLHRLCDEAAARDAVRLTLEVREANTAARALYERMGFTACGRRRGFYETPKEDAIVYERCL